MLKFFKWAEEKEAILFFIWLISLVISTIYAIAYAIASFVSADLPILVHFIGSLASLLACLALFGMLFITLLKKSLK